MLNQRRCENCKKPMGADLGLFCATCSKEAAPAVKMAVVPFRFLEDVATLVGDVGLLPHVRDAVRGMSFPVSAETIDRIFKSANVCGAEYARLARDETPAENPTAEPLPVADPPLSLRHVGAVELHNAFLWDCPHCGSENVQRSVTIHAPAAPKEEPSFDDDDDDDDDDLGVMMTFPNFVRCRDCRQRYRAANLCIGDPE